MTKCLTVSLLLLKLTCCMASTVASNSPTSIVTEVGFNPNRGHRLTVGSYSFGYLEVTERFVSKPPKLSTLVYIGGFQLRVPVAVTTFQVSALSVLAVLIGVVAFAVWGRKGKHDA